MDLKQSIFGKQNKMLLEKFKLITSLLKKPTYTHLSITHFKPITYVKVFTETAVVSYIKQWTHLMHTLSGFPTAVKRKCTSNYIEQLPN